MRILRIAQRLPPSPGGEEFHVLELTRQQIARGHQVRLLYQEGDAAEFAAAAVRVPDRVFGSAKGTATAAMAFGATAALRPSIRDADVIHVHGDFTDAAGSVISPVRGSGARVLTVHAALNMKYRRIAGPIYRRFHRIIALGDAAAADLLQHDVEPDRIVTMSSGLNQALLNRAMAIRPEAGGVVAVGSLTAMKNFGRLIAAFRLVPEPAATLTIVGGGPLEGDLRRMASGDPRIVFTGAVSREEVYEVVARSRIFVMPSRRLPGKGEGLPTALLEAMYLGKECLVSIDAEPSAVVSDPSSYDTFDPTDTFALAELLEVCLKRSGESNARSERARAAVSHLGWEQVAGRVQSVYEEAIAVASR